MAVLKNLKQEQELEIARLKAELEAAKASAEKARAISFKVSDKGAVSVYGLGRFPCTLYLEQWEAIFANVDNLRSFIDRNRSKLKTKGGD